MTLIIGAGWQLVHCTDRVVELRKEDVGYRRILGRDGYVRVRAEPGMDRKALIDRAERAAKESDARLADIAAKQEAPRIAAYQRKQARLAPAFVTPEDPEIIGRKRA